MEWGFPVILWEELSSFFVFVYFFVAVDVGCHFGIDCSVVMDLYWQLIDLPGSVILHCFFSFS
jgi:hypothetical protein